MPIDSAKTIVVTHHAPHPMSVQPKCERDDLTPAFAYNLEHLMGKSRFWVHGHMHDGQRYASSSRRCNSGYRVPGLNV